MLLRDLLKAGIQLSATARKSKPKIWTNFSKKEKDVIQKFG